MLRLFKIRTIVNSDHEDFRRWVHHRTADTDDYWERQLTNDFHWETDENGRRLPVADDVVWVDGSGNATAEAHKAIRNAHFIVRAAPVGTGRSDVVAECFIIGYHPPRPIKDNALVISLNKRVPEIFIRMWVKPFDDIVCAIGDVYPETRRDLHGLISRIDQLVGADGPRKFLPGLASRVEGWDRSTPAPEPAGNYDHYAEREKKILSWFKNGLSDVEMAHKLALSESAIKKIRLDMGLRRRPGPKI